MSEEGCEGCPVLEVYNDPCEGIQITCGAQGCGIRHPGKVPAWCPIYKENWDDAKFRYIMLRALHRWGRVREVASLELKWENVDVNLKV